MNKINLSHKLLIHYIYIYIYIYIYKTLSTNKVLVDSILGLTILLLLVQIGALAKESTKLHKFADAI